jgi:hypothetical protein
MPYDEGPNSTWTQNCAWVNSFTYRQDNSLFQDKKVHLSLCLTKHHTMKTYGGAEAQLHAFLTLELDGDEWSVSCTGCFTPKERVPGTQWTGDQAGARAGLMWWKREKKSLHCPCQDSNPGHLAHSVSTILIFWNDTNSSNYRKRQEFLPKKGEGHYFILSIFQTPYDWALKVLNLIAFRLLNAGFHWAPFLRCLVATNCTFFLWNYTVRTREGVNEIGSGYCADTPYTALPLNNRITKYEVLENTNICI